MSMVKSYHHLVLTTYRRRPVLDLENQGQMFSYIVGIMKKQKNFVFAIGGYLEHIHIAMDMHSTMCLADTVREMKNSLHVFFKDEEIMGDFEAWSKGYFAESFNHRGLDGLKRYIRNQIPHHMGEDYDDEMHELYKRNGLIYTREED